jgi:hypothetical protein
MGHKLCAFFAACFIMDSNDHVCNPFSTSVFLPILDERLDVRIFGNKKAEVFSSASPARWWSIFAQPKGPTIMLEG